ncbi:MAG: hypothetical protein QOH79_3758, partial [Acidimicrobiaceae bacterium]
RCRAGDPDAWAAAIDALDDPEVVDDLGHRGAHHVERYDWDAIAGRILDIYRAALERP